MYPLDKFQFICLELQHTSKPVLNDYALLSLEYVKARFTDTVESDTTIPTQWQIQKGLLKSSFEKCMHCIQLTSGLAWRNFPMYF